MAESVTPLNMASDTVWHPTSFRTHTLGQIQSDGESLVGSEVTICGYMEANRGKGKICFMDIRDGTGRVQTVTKDINENFYKLIFEFYKLSKVPILLNTSFNENEPIVMDLISETSTVTLVI
mgnify:CR=1 FL=1